MTLLQGFQSIVSSLTLLQGFQSIYVFTDSITEISDYFALQWQYTGISGYFGLQKLYDRDFKLFLSSVTLLQGFQAILDLNDSIIGISNYFRLHWLFYRLGNSNNFCFSVQSSVILLKGFQTISVFSDSIKGI